MRRSQSNYLNMAGAVMQHFDNHAETWSNVRTVACEECSGDLVEYH